MYQTSFHLTHPGVSYSLKLSSFLCWLDCGSLIWKRLPCDLSLWIFQPIPIHEHLRPSRLCIPRRYLVRGLRFKGLHLAFIWSVGDTVSALRTSIIRLLRPVA